MNSKRLLIVDDEVDLVENIAWYFTEQGYNVLQAYHGLEALEVVKKNDIDCVVADIRMPNMNGVEFIKQCRELKYEFPFIFLTAFRSKDLMLEALNYSAFDFLDKPFKMEHMEDVIERAIASSIKKDESDSGEIKISDEFKKSYEDLIGS